jgi:hypothetical protein
MSAGSPFFLSSLKKVRISYVRLPKIPVNTSFLQFGNHMSQFREDQLVHRQFDRA